MDDSPLVSPGNLGGHCAIITGSSTGIGLASARRLAAAGADLVVNARHPDRLANAVEQLSAMSPARVVGVPGDAASASVIAEMISTAEEFDGASIAIANAGGGIDEQAPSEEDGAALWRSNVWSTQALIAAVSPGMVRRGWGRIVTISSVAARQRSSTSVAAYAAAKAGVISLTRTSAYELAPHGVTVNSVAPGVTATDRIVERISRRTEQEVSELLSRIPVGRWAKADEVAAAIVFLCGPEAGYITGHTLDINGGMWMG